MILALINTDVLLIAIFGILIIEFLLIFWIWRSRDDGTPVLPIYQHFNAISTQLASLSDGLSQVLSAVVGEKASSFKKGQKFQESVYLSLKGAFPDDRIIYTAPEPYKGDIIAYPRIKLPTGAIIEFPKPIVIDAKEYTRPIGKDQINKLFRDMDRLNAFLGILIVSDDRTISHYSNRYICDGKRTIFMISAESKAFLALYAMVRYSLSLLAYQGIDVSQIAKIMERGGIASTLSELENLFSELTHKLESWENRIRKMRNEMDTQMKELLTQIQKITKTYQ